MTQAKLFIFAMLTLAVGACTSSVPTVEQTPSNRRQGASDDEKQEKAAQALT